MIVSQYIGSGDKRKAGEAASQLLMISVVFSAGLTFLLLLFGRQVLGWIFGRVEAKVMEACVTYLQISTYSYPALAVYNAGATGVAWSSLIARTFSAVAVTVFCFRQGNGVYIQNNGFLDGMPDF